MLTTKDTRYASKYCQICNKDLRQMTTLVIFRDCGHYACEGCFKKIKSCHMCMQGCFDDASTAIKVDMKFFFDHENKPLYKSFVNCNQTYETKELLFGDKYTLVYSLLASRYVSYWTKVEKEKYKDTFECNVCKYKAASLLSESNSTDTTSQTSLLDFYYNLMPMTKLVVLDAAVCTILSLDKARVEDISPKDIVYHYFLNCCSIHREAHKSSDVRLDIGLLFTKHLTSMYFKNTIDCTSLAYDIRSIVGLCTNKASCNCNKLKRNWIKDFGGGGCGSDGDNNGVKERHYGSMRGKKSQVSSSHFQMGRHRFHILRSLTKDDALNVDYHNADKDKDGISDYDVYRGNSTDDINLDDDDNGDDDDDDESKCFNAFLSIHSCPFCDDMYLAGRNEVHADYERRLANIVNDCKIPGCNRHTVVGILAEELGENDDTFKKHFLNATCSVNRERFCSIHDIFTKMDNFSNKSFTDHLLPTRFPDRTYALCSECIFVAYICSFERILDNKIVKKDMRSLLLKTKKNHPWFHIDYIN